MTRQERTDSPSDTRLASPTDGPERAGRTAGDWMWFVLSAVMIAVAFWVSGF